MAIRVALRTGLTGIIALSILAPTSATASASEPQVTMPGKWSGDCSPLLAVTGEDKFEGFLLADCDLSLKLASNTSAPNITFQTKEGVAEWLRQKFQAPGAGDGALARGQVKIAPRGGEILPHGTLIDSEKAHTWNGPKWVWNRREGTLTATDMLAQDYAHWYRVCDAAARTSPVLALAPNMAIGAVFSSWVRKPAPRGMPDEVPKQCVGDWTLSEGAPAVLHRTFGIGMVNVDAKDGDRFTVSVRIGERTLTKEVRVYSPQAHPLIGSWRQVAERECDAGEARKPVVPISEFHLRPDGTFDLTWIPLNHHYIDYTGTYTHQSGTGTFSWDITGGQSKPDQAGRSGVARINERGQLVISGLHPGGKASGAGKLCELVFTNPNVTN